MNKITISGNLAFDPEVRILNNNKTHVWFKLAVNRDFIPKGKEQAEADFIGVKAWGKLAEVMSMNLVKGRKIMVEGTLRIDTYYKDDVKKEAIYVLAKSFEFMDNKRPDKTEVA